ncbi:MAG: hypothetical protein ACYC6Y_00200 [Thermoguttaceae bacterium]
MKSAWLILFAVVLAAGISGCAHRGMYGGAGGGACMSGSCAAAPETCAPCGGGLLGGACAGGLAGRCGGAAAGPPLSAMPYPYYTTRGPRDFLATNPPDIGP